MPLGGLIDVAAERSRIAKDIGKADKEIATLERKLGNADFLARAPEDIVAEQRARLADEQARRQRLAEALATLSATVAGAAGGAAAGGPAGDAGGTP
jgi:valyl-tRNA synthetase